MQCSNVDALLFSNIGMQTEFRASSVTAQILVITIAVLRIQNKQPYMGAEFPPKVMAHHRKVTLFWCVDISYPYVCLLLCSGLVGFAVWLLILLCVCCHVLVL